MKQVIIKHAIENIDPSRVYSLIIENSSGLWNMMYKIKTLEPYKKYEDLNEELEWEKQDHQIHTDAGLSELYKFIDVFMPLELVVPLKIEEHLKKFVSNENLICLEVNFDDKLYDQRFIEDRLKELKLQ